MYRYYLAVYFDNVELSAKCTKNYTNDSDDDFDDFVVTASIVNPLNRKDYFLSGCNQIITSVNSSNLIFYIHGYPKMYFIYQPLEPATLTYMGTTVRIMHVQIDINVEKSTSGYIKLFEDNTFNETTRMHYLISSKPLTFSFTLFDQLENAKSHLLLIGRDNFGSESGELSLTTSGRC